MRLFDGRAVIHHLQSNAVPEGNKGYDQAKRQDRDKEHVFHHRRPAFIAPEITSVSKHYDCPWGPDASNELHHA